MLGLNEEILSNEVFLDKAKQINENEEFKILLITRWIVDKFSYKNYSNAQIHQNNPRRADPLIEKIKEITTKEPSPDYEIEKLYQGNQFLLNLHKACKLEPIKLLIPESIILGRGLDEPIKLWTNAKGYINSKTFKMLDLLSELQEFKLNLIDDYPSFIIRYEYHTSNKITYKSMLYKYDEIDEIISKFTDSSYFNSIVLIAGYIKSKGNLPSKIRAHFKNDYKKIYLLNSLENNHQKEKKINKEITLTQFLPTTLLESLINSNEELKLFNKEFRCQLTFPIKLNKNYFISNENVFEFVRYVYKVFHFLLGIIQIALQLKTYDEYKNRLELFKRYLRKKVIFIESVFNSRITNEKSDSINKRKIWEQSNMVHICDKSIAIYETVNLNKSEIFYSIYNEIAKSLNHVVPIRKKLSEAVIDFIESIEGIHIIKILHIRLEDKKVVILPEISSLKHISLFSATEGSGYSKGKINRQLLCCGDYCSLLQRNDFQTREKIEFLMKHYLEYAGTLFELMKLQDILNIDTVHHLLDRAKRPVTPITSQMQYKVLRKIILEDRFDKYSLRSLILNLPNELIRELNIILQEKSNVADAITINIDKKQNISHNTSLNKKLHWEFELVPVCDKCYKIYSKRIRANKETMVKNKNYFSDTSIEQKAISRSFINKSRGFQR